MAFSVSDIRANVRGGGARPTLFQVSISSPWNPELGTLAPFMIQASEIPPSTLGVMPVPYMGRKINLAGDREFSPWRISVFNDEDFKVRHAFENWHNKINGVSSNLNTTGSAAPANYKVNAEVRQYSKANDTTPIRIYRMYGVWPSDIGGIELSWDATNQYQTFPVTFQYDWHEVVGGSTGTIV